MQTIYLDISNWGVIPVIYAKQNDVGRKVEVVLTNSGLPYEPEAGSAFSAWYSGASGVGNYTDIGEKSAFSVSGNKVTVELITQMLQNAGEGILCLVLSRANGDQIGLWNIRYICECVPGAGSEPAKDYYTAFSQAVAGLAYPDASLSVAGKAADAAAVGTALAGKAPAGYADNGHDTVVAQGTSGGWTYRKWASGFAECWGGQYFAGLAISTSYGNGYCSDPTILTFPFSFVDTPSWSVSIAYRSADGKPSFIGYEGYGNRDMTNKIYLVSASSQVASETGVRIYVYGHWK